MREITIESLEARVTALEEALLKLSKAATGPQRSRDWRKTVGVFKDDEVMKEIFEAASQLRESERQGLSEW
jgi:hypothetical protein